MTHEQGVMVINHSPNYLGSLAFREAMDFIFKKDRRKYMELIEIEYKECKPIWNNEL